MTLEHEELSPGNFEGSPNVRGFSVLGEDRTGFSEGFARSAVLSEDHLDRAIPSFALLDLQMANAGNARASTGPKKSDVVVFTDASVY